MVDTKKGNTYSWSVIRRTLFFLAVVFGFLVPNSVVGPTAFAQFQSECDNPGAAERCYALLESNTSNTGSEYWIKIRDGLVYDVNTMFVISTNWLAMSDGWWVEAGYGYGTFACGPKTMATWYTARSNASGYLEICPTAVPAPSVNTDHQVRVQRLSSPTSSWAVSIDNVLAWNHTSMKTSSSRLELGVEANHWATRLTGAWSWSYLHRSTGGVWSSFIWPNTYTRFIGTPSSYGSVLPPYAVWEHGFWGI